MGSFGDYLEDELLDHVFGNAAFTAPGTIHVALSTADPLDDGSGLAEPVGNGYARVAVTNNATNWPAASGGAKANGTAITFPTATGSWGTLTHFALLDAGAGGNLLGHGSLTASRVVDSGETAEFAIGDLDITLD
jgi:hypothetical protein